MPLRRDIRPRPCKRGRGRFPGHRNPMKMLLLNTAILEVGTGVALEIAPAAVVFLLLGRSLDSPVGPVLCRILGFALFSMGTACWLARNEIQSRAAAGLVAAMSLYNAAVVSLLVHARIVLGMGGIGLLPGVMVHAGLAVWCIACLWSTCRNVTD